MHKALRLLGLSACLATALLAVATGSAAAQRATGSVTDRATGEPVGLAVVALIDDSDRIRQHVLTSTEGAFVIDVPPGGPYRLRVERIGYHAVDSAPFSIEPATDRHFALRIEARPIALARIEASGEQTCAINSSAGEILRVWTEARKALAAASAAERQRMFSFSGFAYTRNIDPDGVVLSRRDRPYANRFSQPFRGLSAEDLIGNGYLRVEEGTNSYYAPSADVLLSREFEEVNCFTLRRNRDDADLIGVGFTPNRRYRLPSVAGTAWLDANTLQLRFVEFGYTNVASFPFANHASGRVDFRMLPNGGWIVNRWWIRMPSAVRQTRAGDFSATSIRVYTEEGGEVLSAVAGGQRFTLGEVGSVVGAIFDSTTARPLAGALVSLGSTVLSAHSDGDGRFQLPQVPEGRYTLTFDHPRLDSLPLYSDAPLIVDVRAGTATRTELAIPPLSRSALSACEPRDGRVAVYGVVRDALTGHPLPEAHLAFSWDSIIFNAAAIGTAPRGRDIQPASDGRYFTCDLPFDRLIDATVSLNGRPLLRTRFLTQNSPTFQPFDVDPSRPISADTDAQLYCGSGADPQAGERVVPKRSDCCTGARGRCGDADDTG